MYKPIIRKFEKRKVCLSFKYNICSADLADIHLINKFNKRFRCLLCVIDVYSKYGELLISLAIETPLSKIPVVGPFLL